MPEMPEPPRIAIVHIGKTGGTWLRSVLLANYKAEDFCPHIFEGHFPERIDTLEKYRLFDAHMGSEFASKLRANLVTVIRNPVDRIVSLYDYWREQPSEKMGPGYAKTVDFDEFISGRSWPFYVQHEITNAQTWQLAAGATAAYRRKHSSLSRGAILQKAIDNIDAYACVGTTEFLPLLASQMERKFGLRLDVHSRAINTTKAKRTTITPEQRERILEITHLDSELYNHVVKTRVASDMNFKSASSLRG